MSKEISREGMVNFAHPLPKMEQLDQSSQVAPRSIGQQTGKIHCLVSDIAQITAEMNNTLLLCIAGMSDKE